MSLTNFTRLTALIGLFAIAAAIGWFYGPAIGRYIVEAQFSTTVDADIDKRSIVYRLDEGKPLVFVFSQPVDVIRVLPQAAVAETMRDKTEGFVYSIEVRLFGSAGAEVARHNLSLHADAPDQVFASGENWRFFRNRPEIVAGMDDVIVQAPSPVVRSEWRLLDADPGVEAVDIRVSERRPLQRSQALAAFRRRSDAEKLELSRGNVFPPDMMTDGEMANTAANMWRPVGPSGVAGRDYSAIVLYEGTRREDMRGQQ